jgi:hypothetical protein
MNDDQTTWLKLGAGVIVGGLLSFRSLPGTGVQRWGSFILSIALGTIIGLASIEFFKLDAKSWTAVLAVSTSTAFGFAVAINLMQQIPDIIRRVLGRFIGN